MPSTTRSTNPSSGEGVVRPVETMPGFSSADIAVNGSHIHCVYGGDGPALILIHGFPEDWMEYRSIMPGLSQRFRVVAVDLPGIGRSGPASGGYEASNLAAQIHALATYLKLERPYIVGHDLGGIVTYAYLRQFPDSVRGAMILDVPIPGLPGWDEANSSFWHVRFIQEPNELAEKLVVGRQDVFLGWSISLGKFTDDERAYYVDMYGPEQIHAAFEIYRAFPHDARWNELQTGTISVPVVVGLGENSFFAPLQDKLVEGYQSKGISNIDSVRIPGTRHYLLTENPEAVANLIAIHAGRAGT